MNINTTIPSTLNMEHIQNARRSSLIFLVANLVSTLTYIFLAWQLETWQLWGLVVISLLLTAAGWEAGVLSTRQKPDSAMRLLIIATMLGGIAGSALVAGLGILLASVIVLLSLVFAAQALPRNALNRVLLFSGLASLSAVAINLISDPIQAKIPVLQNTVPVLAVLAIATFGWVVARQFATYPISTKLLAIFLVLVLFAVAAVTSTATWMLRNSTDPQIAERTILLVSLVVILAAGLLSSLAAQFLTGPIRNLTKVSSEITAGDLNVRAPIETDDEIGELATTFNGMTARLQETLSGLESRVAGRTHDLEIAAKVGRTVSQVRALDVMLKEAVELIREQFNLYYAQVYLVDPSQTNLILQAGTGHAGEQLLAMNHRLVLNLSSLNGHAAIEKRSMVITDTTASANFKPNPLLPNTRSEIAIPLLVGEKVVGVLDMQSEQSGALSLENLSAFEALAGQLAIAIQNAKLLAETNEARAEVEKQAARLSRQNWIEYLDAIYKPETLAFMFDRDKFVPPNGEEMKDTDLSAPITINGETLGNLAVEVEGHAPIAYAGELVHAVAGQVAQQIESLRLLESAERYRFEAEEASRRLTREGWKSYVANTDEGMSYVYDLKEVRPQNNNGDRKAEDSGYTLPLKVRDETVGKLVVQGLDAGDSESVSLANAVAERLGAHIESLRQFEETKRGQIELDKRARQLAAVAEVSSVSSRELDINKMLQSVVRLTQRQFGLYHAHVFTYNENMEALQIAACGWKEGDEHEGTHGTTAIPLAQEQSLVARSARERKAIIVNNVSIEPGWLPNPMLPDTASEMAVPLIIGDQILGVLDVQSDILNAFSEEDANIYTTLASQVSTALQNARSFVRAQQQAERESTLNLISQKIQGATTVEAALQVAARELGRVLGSPLTIAQLGLKNKENGDTNGSSGSNGSGNIL